VSAFLLSLAAVLTLSNEDTVFLVDKFRQACMHGEASFQKGQVKEIVKTSLKTDVRRSYGRIEGARFYEIALSSPAYLVTWEHKPKGTYYTRGCALIARDLPYVNAWEKVLNVQFSSRERGRLLEAEARLFQNEFPLPEEGKKITIDRLFGGRFVSLQVSAMSDFETHDWKNSPAVKRSPLAKSQ
jgi:hypothetical protein